MTTSAAVLAFWETAGPAAWYAQDDVFDQSIRDQFGATWATAADAKLPDWAVDANGAMALILLLDQFPRNIFRNDPRAFATDAMARDVAGKMLTEEWDREIHGAMRQFVYMPFMHSEDRAHQDICVDLMETRMGGGSNALHARAHREIIKRFGRFPYRNNALSRDTTPEEQAFMDDGGYGAILRSLEGTT